MAYNNPKMVYEIFELVANAKTKKDKIKILQQNNTWPVKDILRCIYDESIQFLLPEGKPPYNGCLAESAAQSLNKTNLNYKYLVKGGPAPGMTSVKRENIFISMLETVRPEEAEILILMKDKKSLKGITKPIVKEAYPDLIKR